MSTTSLSIKCKNNKIAANKNSAISLKVLNYLPNPVKTWIKFYMSCIKLHLNTRGY